MIQYIILYSFCDGVQSPELNEVQYVGDIGYYVKGFLWDRIRFMDWCGNSVKKSQHLLSVVLMYKLIKSDRRMLI